MQLRVDVPARLVRRDRIPSDPAPARVHIEVDARVDRPVHRRDVETWSVRERCNRALDRLRQSEVRKKKCAKTATDIHLSIMWETTARHCALEPNRRVVEHARSKG